MASERGVSEVGPGSTWEVKADPSGSSDASTVEENAVDELMDSDDSDPRRSTIAQQEENAFRPSRSPRNQREMRPPRSPYTATGKRRAPKSPGDRRPSKSARLDERGFSQSILSQPNGTGSLIYTSPTRRREINNSSLRARNATPILPRSSASLPSSSQSCSSSAIQHPSASSSLPLRPQLLSTESEPANPDERSPSGISSRPFTSTGTSYRRAGLSRNATAENDTDCSDAEFPLSISQTVGPRPTQRRHTVQLVSQGRPRRSQFRKKSLPDMTNAIDISDDSDGPVLIPALTPNLRHRRRRRDTSDDFISGSPSARYAELGGTQQNAISVDDSDDEALALSPSDEPSAEGVHMAGGRSSGSSAPDVWGTAIDLTMDDSDDEAASNDLDCGSGDWPELTEIAETVYEASPSPVDPTPGAELAHRVVPSRQSSSPDDIAIASVGVPPQPTPSLTRHTPAEGSPASALHRTSACPSGPAPASRSPSVAENQDLVAEEAAVLGRPSPLHPASSDGEAELSQALSHVDLAAAPEAERSPSHLAETPGTPPTLSGGESDPDVGSSRRTPQISLHEANVANTYSNSSSPSRRREWTGGDLVGTNLSNSKLLKYMLELEDPSVASTTAHSAAVQSPTHVEKSREICDASSPSSSRHRPWFEAPDRATRARSSSPLRDREMFAGDVDPVAIGNEISNEAADAPPVEDAIVIDLTLDSGGEEEQEPDQGSRAALIRSSQKLAGCFDSRAAQARLSVGSLDQTAELGSQGPARVKDLIALRRLQKPEMDQSKLAIAEPSRSHVQSDDTSRDGGNHAGSQLSITNDAEDMLDAPITVTAESILAPTTFSPAQMSVSHVPRPVHGVNMLALEDAVSESIRSTPMPLDNNDNMHTLECHDDEPATTDLAKQTLVAVQEVSRPASESEKDTEEEASVTKKLRPRRRLATKSANVDVRPGRVVSPRRSDSDGSTDHILSNSREIKPRQSARPIRSDWFLEARDASGRLRVPYAPEKVQQLCAPKIYYARNMDNHLENMFNNLINRPQANSLRFQVLQAFTHAIINRTRDEPNAPRIKFVNHLNDGDLYPPIDFHYSNRIWHGHDVPPPDVKRLRGCDCVGPCSPQSKSCSCLRTQMSRAEGFYMDSDSQKQVEKGFLYQDGKLRGTGVAGYRARDYPIFECNYLCGCSDDCGNRVVQRGRQVEVKIAKTVNKGWGVFAGAKTIPEGTFIGVYAGELLDARESKRRARLYDKLGRTYIFDIDFFHLKETAGDKWRFKYAYDAYHAGNFTRFLNHSCEPNSAIVAAYVNEANIDKPLMAIFATRPIRPGEEICFSYCGEPESPDEDREGNNEVNDDEGKDEDDSDSDDAEDEDGMNASTGVLASNKTYSDKCRCGAKTCRGRMWKQ